MRGNDWRQVALPDAGTFAPVRPVSVVVPCFEQPDALALTLAGLEAQRFPRELFEVVVVDDGSEPPIEAPAATPLNLRVVRQARRGFGLARARNAGARAAAHDILVFLDGDVIPAAGLLAAHARWHETVSDALTLGFCAYVSVDGISAGAIRTRPGALRELFKGRPVDPPWFERHMARTDDFTVYRDDLFRAVTGHNFGIGRAFFDEVGRFDESFVRYGGEDTEFAYRAQVRGGLLAPVRAAWGWHQGRWNAGRDAKERSMDLQAQALARRIAEPSFRPDPGAGLCAVPSHVVSLDARAAPVERILEATEALLSDPRGDLVVRIELEADRHTDRARLEDLLGEEPRVQVAPRRAALDAFPASPFHVRVPAGMKPDSALVVRLRRALGAAASAVAMLPDRQRVEISRAWALARARRAGGSVADYGEVRTLPARVLRSVHEKPESGEQGVASPLSSFLRPLSSFLRMQESSQLNSRRSLPPRVVGRGRIIRRLFGMCVSPDSRLRGNDEQIRRGLRSILARIRSEARHVRGARTAWRFLKWFAGALRWRLREGGGWTAAPVPAAVYHADPPLGAAIAVCGPRAAAVFAASTRTLAGAATAHADAVLADTHAAAAATAHADAVLADTHAAAAATAHADAVLPPPLAGCRLGALECRSATLGPGQLLPAGIRADRGKLQSTGTHSRTPPLPASTRPSRRWRRCRTSRCPHSIRPWIIPSAGCARWSAAAQPSGRGSYCPRAYGQTGR